MLRKCYLIIDQTGRIERPSMHGVRGQVSRSGTTLLIFEGVIDLCPLTSERSRATRVGWCV